MQVPQPPINDEEVQRHKFYGGISSIFSCLIDQQKAQNESIEKTHDELYEKIADNKALNELINQRINKRTYKTDFEDLEEDVTKLKEAEVAHQTAWATGKMFIVGAWFVFTIIFGWTFSLLNNRLEDYITIIETNEKILNTIRHDTDKLMAMRAEHLLLTKMQGKQFDDHEAQLEFNKQRYKDLRISVDEMSKHLEEVDELGIMNEKPRRK